jgi:hypothetical protein
VLLQEQLEMMVFGILKVSLQEQIKVFTLKMLLQEPTSKFVLLMLGPVPGGKIHLKKA